MFKFKPGVSGNLMQEPCYLHLEVDNWKPIHLVKNEKEFFSFPRVIPTEKPTHFYFTFNGKPVLCED